MVTRINSIPDVDVQLTDAQDGSFPLVTSLERAPVEAFFAKIGINSSQAVRVRMSYERDDFTRYAVVNQADAFKIMSSEIDIHDGLATQTPGLTLFLPLADCVGAVLYDAVQQALMVSHLGRHNTEQYGARESIRFMQKQFGSLPKDILVWLCPAAGKQNYPLFAFNHYSLQEVNVEHLIAAGVLADNIMVDERDTTKDPNFFSHSEFLKGNRSQDGRFIIAATL